MQKSILTRLGVISAAAVAALAIWGFVRLLGIQLELQNDAPMDRVGAVDVVMTTFIAGAIAWAVHATLVRVHWARFWPFVGSTALAISISGPGRYAYGEAAVALIAMHFVVAVVVITGFSMMAPLVDVINGGRERRYFRLPGMPRREAY